jgi:hypothetical protein
MQQMLKAVVEKPGAPWLCLMLCILATAGKAAPVFDGSERILPMGVVFGHRLKLLNCLHAHQMYNALAIPLFPTCTSETRIACTAHAAYLLCPFLYFL